MNFDISHLLEEWDYQPGQVAVRKFKTKDGTEKIQLRVDLGLLQMNATGRPDGKRPFGHDSLFDHFQARLEKQRRADPGASDAYVLKSEDCAKLQQEAIQYHHRYICLFQLEDYKAVIRDTNRNAAVFDFVDEYAESDELAWSLQQFRPQLLMMQIRARGMQALRNDKYPEAIAAFRAAHASAGHPGKGQVFLRVPVYVASSFEKARQDTEASIMHFYRQLGEQLEASASQAGARAIEQRDVRGRRLQEITFDEVLRDKVIVGTPDMVSERLRRIVDELGLDGILAELNCGGNVPREGVKRALELLCKEVMPASGWS